MVNEVRFVISEEDLALGPGTRLVNSRVFVYQSFIKVKKGTEDASGIDIRRGMESAPWLVLGRELYTFSVGYYSKPKECLKVRPTPTIYILR